MWCEEAILPSILFLLFTPGTIHFWTAPGVCCLPDAGPVSGTGLHHPGWVERGSGLWPGGARGVAELSNQHSDSWSVAHLGVWLQPPALPEHRSVPRGRHLCGEVEIHGLHCRSVVASCPDVSTSLHTRAPSIQPTHCRHEQRIYTSALFKYLNSFL